MSTVPSNFLKCTVERVWELFFLPRKKSASMNIVNGTISTNKHLFLPSTEKKRWLLSLRKLNTISTWSAPLPLRTSCRMRSLILSNLWKGQASRCGCSPATKLKLLSTSASLASCSTRRPWRHLSLTKDPPTTSCFRSRSTGVTRNLLSKSEKTLWLLLAILLSRLLRMRESKKSSWILP